MWVFEDDTKQKTLLLAEKRVRHNNCHKYERYNQTALPYEVNWKKALNKPGARQMIINWRYDHLNRRRMMHSENA
jgi:hypothetical protein